MKSKQVIILGAGASKSEGAPLQKDLIKEFFEYVRNTPQQELSEFSVALHDIDEYFSEFWGITYDNCPISSNEFPTFEECLGILDIAKMRNETLRGYPQKRLLEIRNSLIFLIAKILDEKLKNSGKYHRALIQRLKEKGSLLETTFISLNYDILIDNALLTQYDDYHIDYAIDLANYNRQNDFRRPIADRAITLMKIHGSLNWLLCPTCMQVERTPQKATEAFYIAKKCDYCGGIMEPVIIPPTFYKEFSNYYIQQIMLKASVVLRSVSRIVFCGYSFPDADMHIKYLLKQAEKYRVHTPKIYICNGQTESQEMLRYTRYFKEKNRVIDTGLTFENFCEKGLNQFTDEEVCIVE